MKDRKGGRLHRLIFEQARDSILLLRMPPKGTPVIADANPAALALHGYPRSRLVGRPVTVLGASLGRALPGARGAAPAVFEVRQRRRDGSDLVTEVTARNARLGGETYGILVERDVTGRNEAEEKERRLSGRILLAREEEKKRLAASLHDAIGAMQVGISSALLLLEDDLRRGRTRAAAARLARARTTLKELTASLKRACVESCPPALSVSGLGAVLNELLDSFQARSGIGVRRALRLGAAGRPGAAPVCLLFFRLAQEALRNAEKHSGAASLDFSASAAGGWLTLEVRDDGRGFDPALAGERGDCLGLRMMAEAAASAGGYFKVYSKPGAGTAIKAELPLGRGRRA